MVGRWVGDRLLATMEQEGIGCIAFSPLAQGLLTSKYLGGIPEDSRAAKTHGALNRDEVSTHRVGLAQRLNAIAQARGQTLAQLAIAWVLRHPIMTSALVGASKVSQVEDNIAALDNLAFSADELGAIEAILKDDAGDPIW